MQKLYIVRTVLPFVAFGILAFSVPAQDAAPAQLKSPQARQAETKFNLNMQKLDVDYQQKANALKQDYIDSLKTALKTLAKSDNPDTDEIAKLSAKVKEVQASIAPVPPAGAAQTKRISGRWKCTWPTGSDVRTFKKSIVSLVDGREVRWLQDGNMVVVLFPSGDERLTLSDDGRTMKGISCPGGDPARDGRTYTLIGD